MTLLSFASPFSVLVQDVADAFLFYAFRVILRMKGVVQPYAWGSRTFLPELLGTEPTDEPQAELWLGAHPSAPATLDGRSIDDIIAADPEGVLGTASVAEFGPRLSFLLKVLAADEPLSLQAHPSRKQAEDGYAREEKAGVPRDAKNRLFKDDWPKPELLCALIESEALCGFRAPGKTYALVSQLGASRTSELFAPLGDESAPEAERIEQVFATAMRLEDPESYVSELRSAADALDPSADAEVALVADTVRLLSDSYPTDPGVLAALLMNRVKLQPGEAMFLDAGNLHAYLHGAGIEIMANSDNVMRGGLTSKHVDVEQLLSILDFHPIADERIEPESVSSGVVRYPTPATEFALWRLSPSGSTVGVPASESGRALVVVDGSVTLSSNGADVTVERGQAAFLEAGTSATASGEGTAFLASPGL